ncbi:YggS family pyridoxal phosphate-dependent enzyme [Pelotomaculum propionicicum]|uniref:YggS family pyridoxal phosphate-dependent enzyme n=1 Tax=Pelotomaculum propionicicum TaxID=258475 RepID=UPI003B7D4B43
MSLKENLDRIRERIIAASLRAGRDPAEIKLVAVSKTIPVEVIKEALTLGVTSLGENRVQEFLIKQPVLDRDIEWHFIGHLQTNKVKKIIDKVSLIHSLDRWPLAEAISRAACEAGIVARALIQVNVAGEATKYGLSPAEAEDFARDAAALPGLEPCGLMTIAPECDDPEDTRYVFRQTADLARALKKSVQGIKMDILSMGMTGDFEVALEEGSNVLRLGTALFGRRY